MKTILLYSLFCAPLSLANVEREHLIYEEDSFVNAELRCPSPDGRAELVYRGLRHQQQREISVVNDIVIVLQGGKEIPLGAFCCDTRLYRDNLIRQPWSTDGKWLVFPTSRKEYCFCPVAAFQDGTFRNADCETLRITEPTDKDRDGIFDVEIHYILKGGQWESDGTFTFRAGLSGYSAPYSATVSEKGIFYKQTGDMVKIAPKQ